MSAIKLLNGEGKDEMKEVNLMSKLSHENIIKYERAFRTASSQTCILMEFAVKDLHKHLKAKQHGKYLYSEGFMRRHLRAGNILVTKWGPKTDIPTVKLADFGLAGTRPKHDTDCGTCGYIAPDIYEIRKRREVLEKHKGKGMKTVARSGLLTCTNAVDIWVVGIILKELLEEVPSQVACRGKSFPMNEASNCSLAQKREKSPGPSSPNSYPDAEEPLPKVIRKAFEDSTSAVKSSSLITRKAIWLGEQSQARQPSDEARRTMIFPWSGSTGSRYIDAAFPANVGLAQANHLNIQRERSGLLSFNVHSPSGAVECSILITRDNPQVSPSLEDMPRRMLAGLQEAGYVNGITVAGRSTSMGLVSEQLSQVNILRVQLQPITAGSMALEVDFENAVSISSNCPSTNLCRCWQ
ncbi:MAG: hypothetical protein Q9188_006583 [Gyalolechia gomerana]